MRCEALTRDDGCAEMVLYGGLDLASDKDFLSQWINFVNQLVANFGAASSSRSLTVYLDISNAFVDGQGLRILERACQYGASLGCEVRITASAKILRIVRFSALLCERLFAASPN